MDEVHSALNDRTLRYIRTNHVMVLDLHVQYIYPRESGGLINLKQNSS